MKKTTNTKTEIKNITNITRYILADNPLDTTTRDECKQNKTSEPSGNGKVYEIVDIETKHDKMKMKTQNYLPKAEINKMTSLPGHK